MWLNTKETGKEIIQRSKLYVYFPVELQKTSCLKNKGKMGILTINFCLVTVTIDVVTII